MSGRLVTLVVCDGSESVIGETSPFNVETPWWQDILPISERYPSLQVLRLLAAPPPPAAAFGGEVRYLAELAADTRPPPLHPSQEVLEEHPLRMPWARPGGPANALSWALEVVDPSGPPLHHRTWNLSSIWSIPTGDAALWLKWVPAFFGHEAAVLQLLDRPGVPRPVAVDAGRFLMAELPGRDGYEAGVKDTCRLLERLVSLQLDTAGRLPELLAAGVPDSRWEPLLAELASVVARRAPDDIALRRLLEEAPRLTRAIDECGLPDVLVHGDAHPGNARIGCDPPVWFDWGDSRLGNPLLDLGVLERMTSLPASAAHRAAVEAYWLETWREAVPGSDPGRAWRLLRPLAALRSAAVYDSFLDNIEPSERPYHAGDVVPALVIASRLAQKALSP